ncbi:MAG: metallophosphoesterase, partial [Solirubrobacterales bacterium]
MSEHLARASVAYPRSEIPRAARLADDADWLARHADYAPIGRAGGRFSWLSPTTLWQSRNNVLASLTGDPTENARRAWVAAQRTALADRGEPETVVEDFTIERPELAEFSFMLMGDTGEGDVSQFATIPAFLAASRGSEFSIIASDVVYPAGDVNQYVAKFFIPYAAYPQPIYAVPGNHDWLDGLAGFMLHFCGVEAPGELFRPPKRARYARAAMIVHQLFWRRAARLRPETLTEASALRGEAAGRGPRQPNMYFCIDTPQLRIVGIDVGILGRLDHDQGEWLRRVSAGNKPKLLVSG